MPVRAENRTADLNEIRLNPSLLYSNRVGRAPFTVAVTERLKNGELQIWARWREADGKRPERLLSVRTIRDARGRPVTSKQDEALAEARTIYEVLAGLAEPEPEPEQVKPTRLTLQEGLDAAFGENGHWRKDDATKWGANVHRYLTDMVELLHEHNKRNPVTNPLHFDEITPGMLRAAMRTLAKDGKRNRAGQGLERATKMYRTWFALCRWLTGEYQDLRFPGEIYQWKVLLRAAWEEHTGRDLELEAEQSTVRHTTEEQVKLHAALDHPEVDRRLARC